MDIEPFLATRRSRKQLDRGPPNTECPGESCRDRVSCTTVNRGLGYADDEGTAVFAAHAWSAGPGMHVDSHSHGASPSGYAKSPG